MTWWTWLIFWALFWSVALAYLAWRAWRVWPHAREFGRAVAEAMSRLEHAQALGERRTKEAASTALVPLSVDDLAWNKPASHWREQRRRERERQREARLDAQTEVWASWRDPLE